MLPTEIVEKYIIPMCRGLPQGLKRQIEENTRVPDPLFYKCTYHTLIVYINNDELRVYRPSFQWLLPNTDIMHDRCFMIELHSGNNGVRTPNGYIHPLHAVDWDYFKNPYAYYFSKHLKNEIINHKFNYVDLILVSYHHSLLLSYQQANQHLHHHCLELQHAAAFHV